MYKKTLSLFSATLLLGSVADAAILEYLNGETVTAHTAAQPGWVGNSIMYRDLVTGDATASGQTGFAIFNGTYDVSLLSWQFSGMTLAFGGDSVTQSPSGLTTPGYEDYRYTGGAPNLNFYYDGDLWAWGRVTRFITEVDHDFDPTATGMGWAVLEGANVAGMDFLNAVNSLTGGTGNMTFYATEFRAIDISDPGLFESDGYIEVVPEPSTYAALAGAAALGLCIARRRARLSRPASR